MPQTTYRSINSAQHLFISASKRGISACHVQISWNSGNNVYPSKPHFLQSGDTIDFDLIAAGVPQGWDVVVTVKKLGFLKKTSKKITCAETGATGYYIYHNNWINQLLAGPAQSAFSTSARL